VGAGQMGTGIALVGAAKAKVNVLVSDVSQKQLDACLKFADSLVRNAFVTDCGSR
jgi:3-hydroxyacyl-CoA dehydrogenase